ncbi:MAG: replicative DNA helicase [Paludibacteraceae bacterium]|nr:replicative DNA helicase [Paludibacteraceae bacterium]
MPATNNSPRRKEPSPRKVGANDMGKLPPQALDMEESVLGALMLDKEAFSMVSDLLRVDSFYSDKHQRIFEALLSLSVKDQPIDLLSVTDRLRTLGTLEEAGGVAYLSELTRKVASTAHLRYHAQIVAQKATARELIRMAAEVEEKGYDETQDVDELLEEAEGKIFAISQRNQKRDVVKIDSVLSAAFSRMHKAAENKGNISGIPSGFTLLDKITSGWQKSDLIIIAARPAMGKTAFVLSMAKNIAVNYQVPVAMFSLEMSNVQLANRLIMNVCEISGEKIKNGNLTQAEWAQLDYKVGELSNAPLYLDDTPAMSILEFRSKARKLVREKHVQIIIIDYLQLMNANGVNFGSREQEVSIISRNLKALAKELDIPIIALSQLNRSVEQRGGTGIAGKKPQLSDLRESGAIEQDADIVCFIHRPEYYGITNDDKTSKSLIGLGQIIVAKHRNGATDDIWLRFRSQYAKFQNEDDAIPQDELNGVFHSKMNQLPETNYIETTDGMSVSGGFGGDAPF